jgi:hypothetical protein
MKPFDSYPKWGTIDPRCLGGGSCRTGYGAKLQQLTGQTTCAYCGLDLTDAYEHWVLLSVDHVIPGSVIRTHGDGWRQWVDNLHNLVICCSACNGFSNRYRPSLGEPPATFEEFCQVRDRVFAERMERVQERRRLEQRLFETRPWLPRSGGGS